MSRGRLVAVNGQDIKERIKPDNDGDYKRELNLTWSKKLGSDNEILQGEWWQTSSEKPELKVSAEQEYAEGIDLELGDELEFSIAGQTVNAKLASIRSVEWDSMNPNFYMIFNQAISDNFSANWISSFYLPPERKSFISELSRDHPTISVIDFDETLSQIKGVAARVSMAVEFILILVLAASLLVVLTSIQSSIEERLKETALLRSFGASRRFVQGVILIEFASIGFIAGIFACAGAELSLFFIQTRVFEMDYAFNLFIWLAAPFFSAVVIAATGYMSTVATTYTPPMRALKEHA